MYGHRSVMSTTPQTQNQCRASGTLSLAPSFSSATPPTQKRANIVRKGKLRNRPKNKTSKRITLIAQIALITPIPQQVNNKLKSPKQSRHKIRCIVEGQKYPNLWGRQVPMRQL